MMSIVKKTTKSKLLAYLICLLAAVIVWLGVMAATEPAREVKYTDIPVELVYSDGYYEWGYEIVSYTQRVSARLSATREAHMSGKDSIRAVALIRPYECDHALTYNAGVLSLTVSFEDANGNQFLPREAVTVTVQVGEPER